MVVLFKSMKLVSVKVSLGSLRPLPQVRVPGSLVSSSPQAAQSLPGDSSYSRPWKCVSSHRHPLLQPWDLASVLSPPSHPPALPTCRPWQGDERSLSCTRLRGLRLGPTHLWLAPAGTRQPLGSCAWPRTVEVLLRWGTCITAGELEVPILGLGSRERRVWDVRKGSRIF